MSFVFGIDQIYHSIVQNTIALLTLNRKLTVIERVILFCIFRFSTLRGGGGGVRTTAIIKACFDRYFDSWVLEWLAKNERLVVAQRECLKY